jgi:hypothetical protein
LNMLTRLNFKLELFILASTIHIGCSSEISSLDAYDREQTVGASRDAFLTIKPRQKQTPYSTGSAIKYGAVLLRQSSEAGSLKQASTGFSQLSSS